MRQGTTANQITLAFAALMLVAFSLSGRAIHPADAPHHGHHVHADHHHPHHHHGTSSPSDDHHHAAECDGLHECVTACCIQPSGDHDDHHHCCGLCHGHGSTPPAALITDHRADEHKSLAAADIDSADPWRMSPDPVRRRWWPPPRAGPPPHLLHLRTVVLLT